MKTIKVLVILLSLFSLFLAGCGPSAVVVRERPVEPVYVRSVAPGPRYVWVSGAWINGRRGYVYRQGYWALPPRPRVVYHQGYWVPRRNGYYYRQGGWY